MTHDTRTADEIERDIRRERAQMSDSINSLQQKFSVDAIVNDISSMFRAQGGDISRAVTQTVGRNPAAVALVGVGLAWLVLGQNRAYDDSDHGSRFDRNARSRDLGASTPGQGPTIRSGNEAHGDNDRSWFDFGHKTDTRKPHAYRQGHDDHNSMSDALHNAADSARTTASEAADYISHTASDLSERLSHGLEDLSEEARERVMAARQAALDAREATLAASERGQRAVQGFFDAQPLVVGALAVAFGAALGGVLPHSKIEDDTMGDSSDRLFAEAQALFYAERDKAMSIAKTALSEVKAEAGAVKKDLAGLVPEDKTVGEVIVDRAAEVATRVYDSEKPTAAKVPTDKSSI